jgi:hypothetical protein
MSTDLGDRTRIETGIDRREQNILLSSVVPCSPYGQMVVAYSDMRLLDFFASAFGRSYSGDHCFFANLLHFALLCCEWLIL